MNEKSLIIDNINRFKVKSRPPIVDGQTAYIPFIEDDQIEFMTASYLVNGGRVMINSTNQVCFKLKYLQLEFLPPRKYMEYSNGIWDLKYLVDNEVIRPIALFINSIFVPWELLKVVITAERYYIIVDASACDSTSPYPELVTHVSYAQIISMPSFIEYKTDDVVDADTVLYFSDIGSFSKDSSNKAKYLFKTKPNCGHYMTIDSFTGHTAINAFKVSDNTSIKLTERNVILFYNGYLECGVRKHILYASDEERTNEDNSVDVFLDINESTGYVNNPPSIRFDSTLLTVNGGQSLEVGVYDFMLYTDLRYATTTDNINKTDPDGLAEYIKFPKNPSDVPGLEALRDEFSMAMSRDKKYDQNVQDCINTMYLYNSSLFNSVIKETSNLIIEEHDGSWILDNKNSENVMIVPVSHVPNDERIIMLVNGEVYKYYGFCYYCNNEFYIPVQDIVPSDTIELLRFININNSCYDISVRKTDGYLPRNDEYINSDMVLFSDYTNDEYFDFTKDPEGIQHFPVKYSLDYDDSGNCKISFENEFYYGKKLKLAYKNRFVSKRCKVPSGCSNIFKIDLGTIFMYCNDYSRYMIFVNGRKISNSYYRMTIPCRSTTPFTRFQLYLAFPLNEGDYVDIFYVPSQMIDIYTSKTLDTNGDIAVDRSKLEYGLSSDLYMVWLNGRKLPKGDIADINSTSIRIVKDQNTNKNIAITKYIPGIDVLTEAFTNNESVWNNSTNQFEREHINTILGISDSAAISSSEETGNFFDIQWDGDTTDKPSVASYYLVSSKTPSAEDLAGSTLSVVMNGKTQNIPVVQECINSGENYAIFTDVEDWLIVTYEDNVSIGSAVMPYKGIYFPKVESSGINLYISRLFKVSTVESDIYSDAVDTKYIMRELLRDNYWAGPLADSSKTFVYDYMDIDMTAIEEAETDGTYTLFTIADSNITDNLSIDRPWP